MDKKLKRLLQEDMQKEADHISKMLDNRPEEEKEDLPASDYMEVLVSLQKFAETEAKLEEERKAQAEKTKAAETQAQPEAAQSRLSSEEQELIRLGGVYKKRRKWNRLAILVAALVCVLSLGLTATGGPDKLFQEVKRMMSGREQTRVNTDSDRIEAVEQITEVGVYEKIEREFGFYPVYMDYMPRGMEFAEFSIDEIVLNAQLIYKDQSGAALYYIIRPDYRMSSMGSDSDEFLVKESEQYVGGVLVKKKEYYEDSEQTKRCFVDFVYKNAQYSLRFFDVKDEEIEKIVENLFFS